MGAGVVVVTGASRGIGRVISQHLAGAGYRVIGTSRQEAEPALSGVEMVQLDVQRSDSVTRCVDAVLRRAGRIDALVNNAGFDLYGALEETSWDEFEEQLSTNFSGAVRMVKAVLPQMRAQGGPARIVNVGSLGGRVGLPMNSAYAASKFALEGFSESLRMELLPHHIFVSLVVPGMVATDTLDTSIREVASRQPEHSARRAAMVRQVRRDGARSATTPQDVARAVLRALTARRPLLRYPVGAQAAWVPRMKALLPQRVFEWLMQRLFP